MSTKVFGIDFGTSTIKIYQKSEGIVLNERNVIAIANKKTVIAIGDEAFEMYGKAPSNINVIYPVRNGVIADIKSMQALLNSIIKQFQKSKAGRIAGATFVVAVPTDITEVEKRAFYDLIMSSTAKPKIVKIIEKPLANALGVGLDITNAQGVMTVDIGADTTEISILSLGGIVLSKLAPVGGNKLDESIQLCVKKKYNLIIGERTAEQIKKSLAFACDSEYTTMKVYGRNVVTGLPVETEIDANLVYDSIKEHLSLIVDSIKMILERTPPEISSDIIDSGIFITGGSSGIKNLDKLITNETDLKSNMCNEAENAVVLGLGRIIEDPKLSGLAATFRTQMQGRMRN